MPHASTILRSAAATLLAALLVAAPGRARADGPGFALDRYEPTPAGDWFFAVEHPWYSSTRWFAGGLTLDYGNRPLVYGVHDGEGGFAVQSEVIAHQLVLHVDLAASFLDRALVSVSLPVVLYEAGTASGGVAPAGPGVGDVRLEFLFRIFGHAERSPVSLSFGGYVFIPVGTAGSHAGDPDVRVMPRLVAGGTWRWLTWSANLSFLARMPTSIGAGDAVAGNSVGHELQLGLAAGWVDAKRRLHVGPELLLSTVVANFFEPDYTSLELLLGGHYLIANQVTVGVAAGGGLLREPGTPYARALARVAWTPVRKPKAMPPVAAKVIDSDGDGIPDRLDACPKVPGPASSDPAKNGCPPDRDGDGVDDAHDLCPDVPAGAHPDRLRPGCPSVDTDKDGVFDEDDQCPVVPAGPHPDPDKPGCPDKDTDGDGVFDHQDRCPTVPAGLHPDPARPGCPAPDRDGDGVPDAVDKCPDVPGAPSTDPAKNGCPGLVILKNNMLVILSPVFFATNKDVILVQSFAVLEAVAQALMAQPEIKHVSIEGHTDNVGKPARNLALSQRRANSVMRWLADYGVAAGRLTAIGFGDTRPIASNKTAAGRARNRRVEFRIVTPAEDSPSPSPSPSPQQPTPPPLSPKTP